MLTNWLGALPGAAAQGIIWGLMAIGVYVSYKILDLADLTVDGSICTGGAVCAVMITGGASIPTAILAATVAGILTGLLTGLLHTFMGIPAILSGILTQLILWSVNLKIMGMANIALPFRQYDLLLSQINIPRALIVVISFTVALIAALYWFFGTELGASIRATGNNIQMSRAQGINTNTTKVIGLALSNGIVAMSGALLAQYQGFADINMGRGAIVIGLAALFIGDAIVSRFSQNLAARLTGVILGGVVYYFVYQTVVFMGLDADLLKMLSAVIVAMFLAVPYWKKTYFSHPVHPAKGGSH